MGRISDKDIQRVRDATDVVSLISESVVLQKKGRLFWGNCPFHGEKTPSFKIDPATGLWHCFGCGAGGDAFGFVMRRENLEFPEAVRQLADRARIEIVESGPAGPSRGHKDRLMAAIEEAAEYYHKQLVGSRDPAAQTARDYLAGRGFGIEVARTWRLGWSPGHGSLVRHLRDTGFSVEELVDANLALLGDNGQPRDRFFGRIMFPIRDVQGRHVGFGGRIVGQGEPKYLNTGETPVFHKSQNMYAIDIAKNEIVKARGAVVVEGYTDVIALHEAGLRNVVATLGTALTRQHVKLLGRFAPRVVYLFDADEAGLRAAERAAEFIDVAISPAGGTAIDLVVAVIPDGSDPADFVSANGPGALAEVIEHAVPLMQFVLERRLSRHDLGSPEGRAGALSDAASLLATVKGTLLAQDYANILADRLLTDYGTVRKAIDEARPAFAGARADDVETDQAASAGPPSPPSASAKAERALVGLVAACPELREKAQELLTKGLLHDARAVAMLDAVLASGTSNGETLLEAIRARDPELGELLGDVMFAPPKGVEASTVARELLSKLKEFALERQIVQSKARMRALDPVKDRDDYDELFREIAAMQLALDRLRRGETVQDDQEVWD